jgi:hypothetical protein
MPITVIQGPAYVKFTASAVDYVYYTEGNITCRYVTRKWTPNSASFGPLGQRFSSRHMVVDFTPVGMIDGTIAESHYLRYTAADVGKSILTGALSILPKVGNKITWAKAGLSQMPGMKLSALGTVWKGMQFICGPDTSKEMIDAAYWETVAATGADTSFDETKIITPRYTAAWGAVVTAIEPDENGFDVDVATEVAPVAAANYGDVDFILRGLGVACSFTPVSCTEAQMASLVALQGASAMLPGDLAQKASLVVTGTGLTVTLPNMLPGDGGYNWGVAQWRQGAVTFHNATTTFTVGVPQKLVDVT